MNDTLIYELTKEDEGWYDWPFDLPCPYSFGTVAYYAWHEGQRHRANFEDIVSCKPLMRIVW